MKKFYLLLMAVSFSLAVFSQTNILTEDFEGGSLPTGWTQTSNGAGWDFGSNLSSTYWSIPSHTVYAASNDDAAGSSNDGSVDYLITPPLDLTTYSSVILEFASFMTGAYSQTASVEVSTNGGSTWTIIQNVNAETNWTTLTFSLSAYAGQSNVLVGFHANDNGEWASGWAIDDVHIFEPIAYDAAMVSINTAPFVSAGSISLEGTLQNMGANTLTSIDVIWSIDGGTTIHTDNLTGLNVPTTGTYDFIHSVQVDMSVTQSYDVMMWVANPNGQPDGDTSNDQVTKLISSLSQLPQKIVVGEEAGGTWCGWCPRGLVALKDMAHYYPDTWIGISVHNGDPMTNSTYDGALANYISGYPSGMVDRAGGEEVDPSDFETVYQNRKDMVTPVSVDITNISWNSTSREVTFDVVGTFYTNTTGDFRLNAVILEDGVSGTTSSWAQANYYASNIDLIDWEGNNWRNYPNPVPASQMVYDHVAREILGGWSGTTGSIPSTIVDGTPHSYTYSYTVPTSSDETKMHIVGMVIDQTSGEILNAFKTELLPTSARVITEKEPKLYPNPTNGIFRVVNLAGATIEVWNMLGQKIMTIDNANNLEKIDLSDKTSGTYIVRVISNNNITTKKINLIK
ncbi:MAG TPA: Omp28-related outer membrane protein [Bacteroidales bacterium]|nr:Omp28-related outer membrane protein [Bacteroidales bacterium]